MKINWPGAAFLFVGGIAIVTGATVYGLPTWAVLAMGAGLALTYIAFLAIKQKR